MSSKTLVVAFDGMDKELVDQFDLKHIIQEEYGSIDNQTGMTETFTSELFASFITGKNHEYHGVTSLTTRENDFIDSFEKRVKGNRFFDKFSGIREALYEQVNFIDAEPRKYRKEDWEGDTIFEELDDSRPMFVPSYNPSIFWVIGGDFRAVKCGYSIDEHIEFYEEREFNYRKRKLLHELESDIIPARSFLMCHFHRPDMDHHFYGEKEISFDEDRLEELYKMLDRFAKEIKEKALDKGYDTVIFMSDHGLPTRTSHSENAFYSSNIEIFPYKNPKITDFYEVLER
jgi:hypothetical protein